MLLICRAVEVNPLGPVQLQLPPVTGCGPRSTTVELEVTVALVSSDQLVPPFTEMYGVIAVDVHVVVPTVSEMVVDAVNVPDVPLIVTVVVPTAAEAVVEKVNRLLPVVGFVPKLAVTPLGRFEAPRTTEPVNPSSSATMMVSVALAPGVTDREDTDGVRVKLGVLDSRP